MTSRTDGQDELATAQDSRTRILNAALALIDAGGPDAATTRAIAAGAGVQAPVIYRLFNDKQGLLRAVVEHGFAAYVAAKAGMSQHPDPVQDLRNGWDLNVAFGLRHPGLFAILASQPEPPLAESAVAAGVEILRAKIRRIAQAGRLQVDESRALAMIHAAGSGTVLSLLEQPADMRDHGLSEAMCNAVFASILTDMPEQGARPAASIPAIALRSMLDEVTILTMGERALLDEWLARISQTGSSQN